MLLQKTRDSYGNIMLRPVYDKHLAIFIHCTNGYNSFPNRFFKKRLFPVLESHGFTNIRIKELKNKK